MLPVAGCVNVGSADAICDGTSKLRTNHAYSLSVDGGDSSVMTGLKLIKALDASCS